MENNNSPTQAAEHNQKIEWVPLSPTPTIITSYQSTKLRWSAGRRRLNQGASRRDHCPRRHRNHLRIRPRTDRRRRWERDDRAVLKDPRLSSDPCRRPQGKLGVRNAGRQEGRVPSGPIPSIRAQHGSGPVHLASQSHAPARHQDHDCFERRRRHQHCAPSRRSHAHQGSHLPASTSRFQPSGRLQWSQIRSSLRVGAWRLW